MWDHLADLVSASMARLECNAGQTLAEYAILVTLIAAVVLAGVTVLGGNVLTFFNSFAGRI